MLVCNWLTISLISCFSLPGINGWYFASRFHRLPEFDQGKRSCRRRLAGHNERRRKPPPGSLLSNRYGSLSSSIFGKGAPCIKTSWSLSISLALLLHAYHSCFNICTCRKQWQIWKFSGRLHCISESHWRCMAKY